MMRQFAESAGLRAKGGRLALIAGVAPLAFVAGCGPAKPSVDADNDGYDASVGCDDGLATVNPEAVEVCDGIDNDCDGVVDVDATDATAWYADADDDGYGDPTTEA